MSLKKRLASICIAATCVFSASAAPVTSANQIYSNGGAILKKWTKIVKSPMSCHEKPK